MNPRAIGYPPQAVLRRGFRDRARWDDWCEKGILVLILAILIHGPLATGTFRAQDFLITQWLVLGVAILWGTRLGLNAGARLYWPPLCWPLLALILYALARYFTADIGYVARQEWVRVLVYGVVFLAFINNLTRLDYMRWMAVTLVFLGMFIGLYSLVQYLTGSNHVWHFVRPEVYDQRGSGTFINPNHMAGYLEMVLPLAMASALMGSFRLVSRIVLGYAALAIFAGVLVSFSRGGWLACAASALPFFGWLLRKQEFRRQGMVLLAALLAIGVFFALKGKMSPNRFGEMMAARQGENIRLLVWKPAWAMFVDHPWTGVGPDHFDARFRQYRPEHHDMQIRPDRVHNDYLNLLVDWGLAGGLLAGWFLVACGGRIREAWRFYGQRFDGLPAERNLGRSLLTGACLGLLALLVHSFFDYNMHVPANAMLATVLLAMAMVICRVSCGERWMRQSGLARGLGMAGLGLVSVYMAWLNWGLTQEALALRAADRARDHSQAQIALLRDAFAHQPSNYETAYRLGEIYRMQSWEGRTGYEALAEEAIGWFEKAAALQPWDPYSRAKHGMCLDWLKRHQEALPYYEQALELDPRSYYMTALMGWHYFQAAEWARSREWFHRSLKLFPSVKNVIATHHLQEIARRLEDGTY